MHSFFLILMWRRKLLILSSAFLFLISIWAWAIFYTAYTNNKSDIKEITIHMKVINVFGRSIQNVLGNSSKRHKYRNRMSFMDDSEVNYELHILNIPMIFNFKTLNKDREVFSKYEQNVYKNAIRFVPPTRNAYESSISRFKEHLKFFDTSIFSKDSEKILKSLDIPSRDEIIRRREADRIQHSAEMQSHYEHELQRMGIPIVAGIGPGGHAPPTQRLVHLDLKGAPPKINYLKRLLPIFKSLGATGLLIEYEDMFPYASSLRNLSAKNAYTKSEIKELLHAAKKIQTFGHLEFALKLQEYEHLREVPDVPQSICPSQNDSHVFIEEMIAQVVELHNIPTLSTDPNDKLIDDDDLLTPNFTHLHIGCDEVFRMGECSQCRSKEHDQLFLSHVRNVAKMVKKRWPHLKVVIWDDMLRRVQLADLQKSEIGKLVEPMVWVYVEDIYRFVPSQAWDKYASVFPTAWVASSFKGAHGEQLIFPPVRRHLENNLKWLAVVQSESARFSQGIQGIALTGWQRYDHFAVLCELLPTSIPSLAVCLSSVSKGYFNVDVAHNVIFSALTCPEPSAEKLIRRSWIELHQDPELSSFSKCMFPGSSIFRFSHHFKSVATETGEYIHSLKYKKGWMSDYNIRHNFSSPSRVEELTVDARRLKNSLSTLANNAEDAMHDVYDNWTIKEFIELHINPLMNELTQIEKKASVLTRIEVWPRRPLPYFLERK